MTERNWTSRARAYFLKHEWLRGYALLSPTLSVMICALALPILTLVVYSFWTQDYVHIDKTATLKNYGTFFDKWMYGGLLLRSIRVSATVTVITILLAYPVAYFLAFKVRKNIMTWLILINLPFWTSYLLRVLAWKIMLGNNGVINSTLLDLGFIQGPLEFLLYSRFAVSSPLSTRGRHLPSCRSTCRSRKSTARYWRLRRTSAKALLEHFSGSHCRCRCPA